MFWYLNLFSTIFKKQCQNVSADNRTARWEGRMYKQNVRYLNIYMIVMTDQELECVNDYLRSWCLLRKNNQKDQHCFQCSQ